MSALGTLFSGPLAQAIGWALVHLLWQGVLVAAILAAALALMQRQSSDARYIASCGALLLLVGLGVATAWHVYEPAVPAAPPRGELTFAAHDVANPTTWTLISEGSATTATSWADRARAAGAFAATHLPQLVLVWIVGVLLLSLRLLGGWLRAHRIATRDAVEATPEWQRTARRLAHALHMRGAIRLLESAAVEVPTVIGWLRPVVLLPVATLSGLSSDQMEMVLAHELAHIRRHDFLINLMQAVVETLLFYHPAVWWISSCIRAEREHCCDDVAVSVCGNALLYARALTRLEELRVDPAQAVLAANGGSLLARIRRIAGARAEATNGTSRWAAGAALLTVLVALVVTSSLPLRANAQQPPAAPTPVITAAPPAAPAAAPKATPANCNLDVIANADESDDNMDIESLDDPTPAPDEQVVEVGPIAVVPHVPMTPRIAIAPRAMAMAASAVTQAVAPTAEAMAVLAPEIAAQVVEGVQGGIEGGVEGGVASPRARVYSYRGGRPKIGASGKLTVDDLISLRAAGVTPAYIDEMRGAGLGELSLDDIAALRLQGVTARYVTGMRNAGLKVADPETALALRIQGVTPEYMEGMKNAGYPNLSAKELITLRVMGVSPAYVKQLADAGYRNLSARDLTSLRAQGVTPEFIKALSDAGYTNLTVHDLTRMAAVGVSADFIRELAKYRTK